MLEGQGERGRVLMDALMEGWHLSCEPRGLWVHRGLGRGNGWGQAVGQWLVLEEEQRRPRQFSHGADAGRAEREVREATGAHQAPCLDVRIYFYPRWWGGLWRVFSGEVTWYDIHLKRSTLAALLKIHKEAGELLGDAVPLSGPDMVQVVRSGRHVGVSGRSSCQYWCGIGFGAWEKEQESGGASTLLAWELQGWNLCLLKWRRCLE